MIEFKIKHLTAAEIYGYLTINDNIFNPPLSGRVNLRNFSFKLKEFATHFCVFEEGKIIGFAACYFNDPGRIRGYISTISISKKNQRKGLATKLLEYIINFGIKREFTKISLSVRKNNLPAIKLYQKFCFFKESTNIAGDVLLMTLDLPTAGILDK
jgi:ribosomal protein S18 acetylase RimI-like enzyme